MDVGAVFLDILKVVSDSITNLVGLLPNPDPFPEIIEEMEISPSDSSFFAYYWVNEFVDVPFVVTVLAVYFTMFAVAWIIMLLWKWMKAR